jgi:hypothetical protein
MDAGNEKEKKSGYEENWLVPDGAHLQAQCDEEALKESI